MAETMKRLLLGIVLPLVAMGAVAQAVQDPTRPPAQLLHPGSGAPTAGVPQLQSILIGRAAGGRRVAVIDGATVRVGDRVGDAVTGARVVAIYAGEVQLDRAGTRETLKLPAPAALPRSPE